MNDTIRGTAFLCEAWGETEVPGVAIVYDLEGVRDFFVREVGGDDIPTLEQLEEHDWEEPWEVKFEIGGVRISDVYESKE